MKIKFFVTWCKPCYNKILNHSFGDLSVENVSELNRIQIHAQCIKTVTGVQVSVTCTPNLLHVHWLAHFFWHLLIVMTDKGIMTEMSYSDARLLVTFFLGFHIVTTVNMFLFLPTIKKWKNIRYAPSYKSDSLVFQCSFYYILTGRPWDTKLCASPSLKDIAISFFTVWRLLENAKRIWPI
jgi:hypothetical protein